MSAQTTFPSILQDFFYRRLVAERGASARTVASYRDAFELLLRFAERRTCRPPSALTFEDVDAPMVLAFLDHLEEERGNSVRTRNNRLAAIRSFLRYASLREPASLTVAQRVLAIPRKRFDVPLLGFISRDEVKALLNAPSTSTWSGQRDRVLLATLYNTGARVSEIIGLRVADVLVERESAVHLRGKGRKERVVHPAVRSPTALPLAAEPATREEPRHAARDQGHHARHVLARQAADGMKPNGAFLHGDHAVQHERVEVDVEIERATEPLDDDHGAAPPVDDALAAGALAQEPEDRPHGDAGHGPTQCVVPGQQVPQPMRQTEDPLPDGHVGEDPIDEMRRPLRHPAASTTRAEPPPLARERDQTIQATGGAPESGEAARQTAALQKVPKLLLHEARQPLAVPQQRGMRAERLEVVPDDAVQDGGRRIARRVRGRGQRHAPSRGASRATRRNRSFRPRNAPTVARVRASEPRSVYWRRPSCTTSRSRPRGRSTCRSNTSRDGPSR
jgi:site-specific recombinase XerC